MFHSTRGADVASRALRSFVLEKPRLSIGPLLESPGDAPAKVDDAASVESFEPEEIRAVQQTLEQFNFERYRRALELDVDGMADAGSSTTGSAPSTGPIEIGSVSTAHALLYNTDAACRCKMLMRKQIRRTATQMRRVINHRRVDDRDLRVKERHLFEMGKFSIQSMVQERENYFQSLLKKQQAQFLSLLRSQHQQHEFLMQEETKASAEQLEEEHDVTGDELAIIDKRAIADYTDLLEKFDTEKLQLEHLDEQAKAAKQLDDQQRENFTNLLKQHEGEFQRRQAEIAATYNTRLQQRKMRFLESLEAQRRADQALIEKQQLEYEEQEKQMRDYYELKMTQQKQLDQQQLDHVENYYENQVDELEEEMDDAEDRARQRQRQAADAHAGVVAALEHESDERQHAWEQYFHDWHESFLEKQDMYQNTLAAKTEEFTKQQDFYQEQIDIRKYELGVKDKAAKKKRDAEEREMKRKYEKLDREVHRKDDKMRLRLAELKKVREHAVGKAEDAQEHWNKTMDLLKDKHHEVTERMKQQGETRQEEYERKKEVMADEAAARAAVIEEEQLDIENRIADDIDTVKAMRHGFDIDSVSTPSSSSSSSQSKASSRKAAERLKRVTAWKAIHKPVRKAAVSDTSGSGAGSQSDSDSDSDSGSESDSESDSDGGSDSSSDSDEGSSSESDSDDSSSDSDSS